MELKVPRPPSQHQNDVEKVAPDPKKLRDGAPEAELNGVRIVDATNPGHCVIISGVK